jgi:hypothetical protein
MMTLNYPAREASRDKTDQRAVHSAAGEGEVCRRGVGARQMKVGNMGTLLDLKRAAGAARDKGLSCSSEPDPCQVQLVRSAKVFDGTIERVLFENQPAAVDDGQAGMHLKDGTGIQDQLATVDPGRAVDGAAGRTGGVVF